MNREVEEFLSSHPFAETTKETYRRVLDELIDIDLRQLTAAGLVRFVSRPEWGSSQRYTALCAVRGFIRWLYGVSHPALTARVKRSAAKPQRVLSITDALNLLASFDTSTSAGARDLALAALALDTGLRVSELCRLQVVDINLEERTLQVIVKGGQWGRAVFSPQTAQYLAEWLVVRRPAPGVGSLFISFHHQSQGKGLTREGMQGLCKRWGRRIGISLSPHDFRRSFATLATIYGAPSRVVQVAGRWSGIELVERYTRDLSASEIDKYLPVRKLIDSTT